MIRNGVSPGFLLEILEFYSLKAYLTFNDRSDTIILDDQGTTVKDVLTLANAGIKPGIITRIKLQRDGKIFSIFLRELFSDPKTNINIQSGDHIFVEDSEANIETSSSVVDYEGNVVFERIGKIKASGLTLSELRIKIESLIQPIPDSQNAFQIQITKFASKTALLSIQEKPGILIQIKDKPIKLSEVLTQNGFSIDSNNITQIGLKRGNKTYVFTLDDLLDSNMRNLHIQPKDQITTSTLPYKENKVFILGGVSPQILKSIQQTAKLLLMFYLQVVAL